MKRIIKTYVNFLNEVLNEQKHTVEDRNKRKLENRNKKKEKEDEIRKTFVRKISTEDRNKRKLENRNKRKITSITNISDSDALAWASKLYDSMKGIGTNEGSFNSVTEKFYKCESCIKKIRIAFKQAYGSDGDLRNWIEGDFSGEAERKALKDWGYVN